MACGGRKSTGKLVFQQFKVDKFLAYLYAFLKVDTVEALFRLRPEEASARSAELRADQVAAEGAWEG